MHPDNFEARKLFGFCHGFKVWTDALCLGVFITYIKSKHYWLNVRIKTWGWKITNISEYAGKYPQESNVAVECAIQLEWIYLQHVMDNTRDVFASMEKLLQENFFPCLFLGKSKSLTPLIGTLSTVPVTKSVLGLQNPMTSANEKI